MPSPSIFSFQNGSPVDPRSILSSIGEVVYGWDIQSDTLNWGPNAAEVFGAIPEQAMQRGLAFAGLVEPGSGPSRYDAIFCSSEHDRGEGVIYRTRYAIDLAGRKMWAEDTGRWFAGSDGYPASARGVLRLERAARPDELEQFGNELCDRPALVERIGQALQEHLPAERPVVVLVATIDELARLNDDFGHEATDEIISTVHERLRSVTRRRDHLVRYAGNSFAILLVGCPPEQVEQAARRFIKVVAQSAIETSHGIALVRLRVGAASAPELGSHGGTLLAAAEGALASARAGSIDTAVTARPQPRRSPGTEQTGFDVQAIAALNDRRVRLALQPIVRTGTRETAFHEALLRVGQGDTGLYFASAELIPMLERRGLVRLFDQRVLELAIEMLGADPTLNLSVNVSPRSLNDPEWFDAFIACTAAARGMASRLIVEITETATIESPARIAELLGRIKDQGARVAIDDFGAGHTSLRHLRAFPIDILKIDGAFTQNLRRSTDDRFYVRTLVELAGHLGVETVAEWVDDEMQASMLRDWGVTYLQGHLVGRAELRASVQQASYRKLAAG
ncbi:MULTISPECIES: EAL domain-containing protein [Bosea]|uniref:EAL domain-containing protein n=1 Tax=Bosea TaxID=85413 RepID=UPI0021506454|nr:MULTISPECIES: bifunctional diguanylate cyclase/phosphodiesterase [Bosea]MCR4519834.1 bifunctional diguanylate cyclase/phosphodiesterase [Bosea sp. 47.2.35]MDR6828922.1 diguanylate cyclase (GGDEF)-like protein [Bosea robiniae]MDR6895664.1 diguanylate cyclase (GGDEF)-like protein [Bosea sp. BE109]MDR7139060.1 diguanylate cyclase (GGDEF)-like protein [Bosea sp. BE168]MDR7175902.1 diguanylate cyclase (GGDEF)-like protein [Bosea sp. BE271]